jgi:hypothetical protein
MYQAWMQGNEHYVRDWLAFVDWAAHLNNTTNDRVIQVLQTTNWFKKPQE